MPMQKWALSMLISGPVLKCNVEEIASKLNTES
jgi:hypothetical protein